MWKVDSLEKTLMLGGIGGRRRRGPPRMRWLDGITYSMHMSLSELRAMVMGREAWRAAFMGSQSIGHDWATELNWLKYIPPFNLVILNHIKGSTEGEMLSSCLCSVGFGFGFTINQLVCFPYFKHATSQPLSRAFSHRMPPFGSIFNLDPSIWSTVSKELVLFHKI